MQPDVLSRVDYSHTAAAQLLQHPIVGDCLTGQGHDCLASPARANLTPCIRSCRHLQCRLLQKLFWFSLARQQRFHFSPQRVIASASLIQEGDSLALVSFPSRVIKLLDLLPAIRRHTAPPCRVLGASPTLANLSHGGQYQGRPSAPRLF